MRILGLVVIVVALAMFVTSCMPVASPAVGVLYTDVKAPLTATDVSGDKHGEACAQSVLGLVATGDASIDTAKKNGGISEVSRVDYHSTSVLGVYATFCVSVYGK